MPKNLLSISHLQQHNQSDCLPVAIQMVTNHLGLAISYAELTKLLGTQWFGTPFRHIERLKFYSLHVSIGYLGLSEIGNYLEKGIPVISCLHTADLSYWTKASDHVVVVVGIDDIFVYVNDPVLATGHQPIPHAEFELAQLEFDNLCAVLYL